MSSMKHSELVERVALIIHVDCARGLATIPTQTARKVIAEVLKAQSWQPIETAPKDEASLLLARFKGNFLKCVHVGGYRYAINEDEESCWWSDQDDDEICPTHWMPLPTPPQEEAT